jgi:hypothetical protein
MTRAPARGWNSLNARLWLVSAMLLLTPGFLSAAQPSPERSAELHFLIIRQGSGKPIRNASVVLQRLDKGRQRRRSDSGYQLKTDGQGRASVNGIDYGRLRVQVFAHGLQTYGEDYDVNQPAMEFTIELKPPKEQISVY